MLIHTNYRQVVSCCAEKIDIISFLLKNITVLMCIDYVGSSG